MTNLVITPGTDDYCGLDDMLLKVERIATMEGPRSYDIEFLRSWFSRPTLGSSPILGIDKIAWDSQYEDDLVGIKPRTTPDTFSHWFTEKAVPLYHHLMGEKFKVRSSVLSKSFFLDLRLILVHRSQPIQT